ncbi:MAG: DEAD/DEAH box helicase [Actinomycetota bacterium]|nr:DEAD/DEAH box helicase [Actinomycetota bacterium]
MTGYADFLASKQRIAPTIGSRVDAGEVHPFLHEWQAEVVSWAVEKGRAALWEDTGLGKTVQALEWARLSGDTSLIVAPLAVCQQTATIEAPKLDLEVRYARNGDQVTGPGMWITNYEMADRFDPHRFDAVVLDEASILKNETGKTRTMLINHFAPVPRRLDCTATPAPNDADELTNHAEFLGVCSRVDMLASYFIHDDQGWRMKGHAVEPMYQWLTTWAIALRRPSDLGFSDEGYILPGLEIIPELLPVEVEAEGQLFATDIGGVSGRAAVRRQTLDARCARAAELVENEPGEPWLLWCGLNDEADLLAKLLPDAVNVHGGMSPEAKAEALLGFTAGHIRYLITKPKLASFGMNWQHCARMAFVGLGDSMEQYYQAIRRCYRYGQPRVVHAHIVLSELESQIAANVARKEKQASALTDGMVRAMSRARNERLVAA